jgi:hypothetical protein
MFRSQQVVIAAHTATDEDIAKGPTSAILTIIVRVVTASQTRLNKPFLKLDSGSSLLVDKLSSRRITMSFHRNWKYTGNCQRRSNAKKVGCVAIARVARLDGAIY